LRVEICGSDGFTPDKEMTDRIVDEAMKGDIKIGGKNYGLVLDIGGYYKNVITLAPSLTIGYEEIDLALELLAEVFRRAAR
jgi:4-aminobutyrate aminotransferase / (S)-3-amino-2-methylpropionate transaminase / 5-aminovalerate transaminase